MKKKMKRKECNSDGSAGGDGGGGDDSSGDRERGALARVGGAVVWRRKWR